MGERKTYHKIDIFVRFKGQKTWKYACSTNWSINCRQALLNFTRRNPMFTEDVEDIKANYSTRF